MSESCHAEFRYENNVSEIFLHAITVLSHLHQSCLLQYWLHVPVSKGCDFFIFFGKWLK